MRLNLNCPYAEKDVVKALGARWDPTRKTWYVENVEDLTPFDKWFPPKHQAKEAPKSKRKNKVKLCGNQNRKRTGPAVFVPLCHCDVLPWDHCEHTLQIINNKKHLSP